MLSAGPASALCVSTVFSARLPALLASVIGLHSVGQFCLVACVLPSPGVLRFGAMVSHLRRQSHRLETHREAASTALVCGKAVCSGWSLVSEELAGAS